MKKYYLLIVAAFTCLVGNVNAQAPNYLWVKALSSAGHATGQSVAVDNSGNVYTTGYFNGTVDFDPGVGVFNLFAVGNGNQSMDIFVSKLDNSGNFLWAKRMGGNSDDFGMCIAIDPAGSGDVYITGAFNLAADFDPGVGVFYLSSAGNRDIFISKLDSAGNFVWAKRMGGSSYDNGISIAIDPAGSGDVYTTGYFSGTADFDPGPAVFNLTPAGTSAIFISKLDNSGNFVWAKAMGGTNANGNGNSVAIDPAGSGGVYITGQFDETVDFDPGVGVYNLTSVSISADIFISKLDSSGNFVWAKAMGAADGLSWGNSIAIDPAGSGDVYTTGRFEGTAVDFDPGVGVFTLTTSFPSIFISKLDSSGNFVWAKAMGFTSTAMGNSIAIDPAGSGDVYTTGYFQGTVDFDPGAGVFNLTPVVGSDIFISKLDSSGNFVWAKAAGGQNSEEGHSIAISASGNAHVAGNFSSPSIAFDLTTLTNGSPGADAFIVKLAAQVTVSNFSPVSGCGGGTSVVITGTNFTGATAVTFGGINAQSFIVNSPTQITAVPALGNTGTISVTSPIGTGTSAGIFTFNAPPVVTANASPDSICVGGSSLLTGSGAATYVWNPGALLGSPTVTPGVTTIYTVTGTAGAGCSATSVVTVDVTPLPTVTATASPDSICVGGSSVLTGSGAAIYLWNPGAFVGSPTVTPGVTTTYTVTGTVGAGCSATSIVTVDVTPIPSVTATASPDSICVGGSSVLTGSGAATYLWNPGALVGSPTITPGATTIYTVTGTAAAGCSATSVVTVVVSPIPTATATASPDSICEGSNSVLTGGGAFTYFWNPGGLPGNPSVAPTTTTTYTVTGTNGAGCTSTSAVTVTVIILNPVIINATGVLSVSGGPYTNYQWFLNGSPIANATNPTYIVLQNGDYEVEVVLYGCVKKSATISLNGVRVEDVKLNPYSVSPNPVTDKITIQGALPASIEILNMEGQVIKEARRAAEISLSNLSNGIYFIQLLDEKGRLLYKQKITKQ